MHKRIISEAKSFISNTQEVNDKVDGIIQELAEAISETTKESE